MNNREIHLALSKCVTEFCPGGISNNIINAQTKLVEKLIADDRKKNLRVSLVIIDGEITYYKALEQSVIKQKLENPEMLDFQIRACDIRINQYKQIYEVLEDIKKRLEN
jgi:hypothetical protein